VAAGLSAVSKRACALLACWLALFWLAAGPAAAAGRTPFQARCEDSINKSVSILTAQQNGYSVDNRLSFRALTVMKGAARANTYVLGLTKTDSRVAIASDGAMLTDPVTGYECVSPQVSVKLSYAPVLIYVSSEFPPGSCGYKEILEHEFRHMKAYMDHLPKVEQTVRAALANRYGGKPLYAPGGTARTALAREIDTGWLPYIKAEMAKVETVQAQIDAPAEYMRLSKACNGEIQAVLSKGLGRRK
jgi:hypothetical protein